MPDRVVYPEDDPAHGGQSRCACCAIAEQKEQATFLAKSGFSRDNAAVLASSSDTAMIAAQLVEIAHR